MAKVVLEIIAHEALIVKIHDGSEEHGAKSARAERQHPPALSLCNEGRFKNQSLDWKVTQTSEQDSQNKKKVCISFVECQILSCRAGRRG